VENLRRNFEQILNEGKILGFGIPEIELNKEKDQQNQLIEKNCFQPINE
jgi:hypothetical protein